MKVGRCVECGRVLKTWPDEPGCVKCRDRAKKRILAIKQGRRYDRRATVQEADYGY